MLDRYDYGILGVGEIGAAIVTGLCADVDDAPRILLSPRNARRSADLAARYPSVSVAPDNQSVASRSAVVVLSAGVTPPNWSSRPRGKAWPGSARSPRTGR
jgi:pyrroline-5-carboxylate reductase